MKVLARKVFARFNFAFRLAFKLFVTWKLSRVRRRIKKKKRVKVVFLPILESVWKYESVYKEMAENTVFEIEVAVLPLVEKGKVNFNQYFLTCDHFSANGYKVVKLYDYKKNTWTSISSLKPDIVLYSDCWPLSLKKYYYKTFFFQLCGYVPYSHQVSKYDDYQAQYNKMFHNFMWKIFAPHIYELDIFKSHSITRDDNVKVSGYPGCVLLKQNTRSGISEAWPKGKSDLRRIVWAPHHSILWKTRRYSNFLDMYDFMQELAEKLINKVQFCFKPHPMLRSTLYGMESWGKDRTDEYYGFWENHPLHLLNEGDYIELFNSSDALIHDSGSFLAEYLYVNKPVLFLQSSKDIATYFNPFGQLCLNASYVSDTPMNIQEFIEQVVIGGNDVKKQLRSDLWGKHLSLSNGSAKIICNSILNEVCNL